MVLQMNNFKIFCENLELSPSSILRYLRGTRHPSIKEKYSKLFYMSMHRMHDLTKKWDKLLKEKPDLTPLERAQSLGNSENLSNYTVASYVKHSEIDNVKRDGNRARYLLSKKSLQEN